MQASETVQQAKTEDMLSRENDRFWDADDEPEEW
jgi:hypothetical protein